MKVTVIPIIVGTLRIIPKKMEKKVNEPKTKNKDCKDDSTPETESNTETNIGKLKKLTVTRLP